MATLSEEELSTGLQPIRFFALAQVLYTFLDCGAHDVLVESGPASLVVLSETISAEPRRLRGLLQHLHNEGYVLLDRDTVGLTDLGRTLGKIRPWYMLLVGGYAQAFQELPDVLKAGGPYATRNGKAVGIGSCGISQHDALPMTRTLLDLVETPWRTVVDLGCGDGSYLIDLCESLPGVRGLGLDPSVASVEHASARIAELGLGERIEVREGSALATPDLTGTPGPLCFITAFVLQEVLEQSGRQAVVDLLATNFRNFPDAHWIVIEVDERAGDASVMSTDLGKAYYNPYYLLHHLTEQRLETISFWRDLFKDAGAEVLATTHPDPAYDPLRLKVGFLLGSGRAS